MSKILLEQEAQRLYKVLGQITRPDGEKYSLDYCRQIAPLTSQINELKKQKNALITLRKEDRIDFFVIIKTVKREANLPN